MNTITELVSIPFEIIFYQEYWLVSYMKKEKKSFEYINRLIIGYEDEICRFAATATHGCGA